MDLFLPIVLFIVFCVLFSICGWCCKKHREGHVYGFASNPTVTVTSQPAAAVIPPYPIDVRHQQMQPTPPVTGFVPSGGYQSGPYPVTTSYTAPPAPGFYPMPLGGGGYPPATPYSTAGVAPYPTTTQPYPPVQIVPYPPVTGNATPYPPQQLPPSYTEAVGQPPAEPHLPVNNGYTKQAPYNPHY